jgi:tRNA A37 threonylcarbamoyltransferase TsaD
MPLTSNNSDLCTDNAAMIAWMGWESINAKMNVDIRKFGKFNDFSHHNFPLGSHSIDLIDIKSKTLRTLK